MKRLYSDRELLQQCLLAMKSSKNNGGYTDWSLFIKELEDHLAIDKKLTNSQHDTYQKCQIFVDKICELFGNRVTFKNLQENDNNAGFELLYYKIKEAFIKSKFLNSIDTQITDLKSTLDEETYE
jgi:hypothetical protein